MNLKLLCTSLLMSASVSWAQSLQVKVEEFNFSYSDPQGSGEARSFSRSQKGREGVSVEVQKVEDAFAIQVSGAENDEFLFKDAPGFVKSAQTMIIEEMNFDLSNSISLSLEAGEFISPDDELILERLQLQCHRDLTTPEIMDQAISGCVQNMRLKASKYSSELVAETLVRALTNDSKAVGIKGLDLSVNQGNYELSADVKAQISGKAKSRGFMSYDAEKGVLSIKIKEVKFGLLTVTKMVFDELKKQQNDKLRVKEPYVYYSVK